MLYGTVGPSVVGNDLGMNGRTVTQADLFVPIDYCRPQEWQLCPGPAKVCSYAGGHVTGQCLSESASFAEQVLQDVSLTDLRAERKQSAP